MAATVRRKVRGGKLLQVRVDHDGSFITAATITGDFFVHPEEGLGLIEAALLGVPVKENEAILTERIEAAIAENGLMVLGFGPRDLAAAVQEALT